jgi:hypothetical protein
MQFWDEFKPVRKHQWAGAMADIRAARYDGLAAYSPRSYVAGTGALAGAGICLLLLLLPLSFVRLKNFLPWAMAFSAYGAFIGLWRQKDAFSKRGISLANLQLAPHSLFNYIVLPLLPVILIAFWEPKGGGQPDNFFGAIITCMFCFWIGALFDYVWEALHNLFLGRIVGLYSDDAVERTLRMWIQREESSSQMHLHSVKCKSGDITVIGVFPKPAEIRRKLLLLDFVKTVTVVDPAMAAAKDM